MCDLKGLPLNPFYWFFQNLKPWQTSFVLCSSYNWHKIFSPNTLVSTVILQSTSFNVFPNTMPNIFCHVEAPHHKNNILKILRSFKIAAQKNPINAFVAKHWQIFLLKLVNKLFSKTNAHKVFHNCINCRWIIIIIIIIIITVRDCIPLHVGKFTGLKSPLFLGKFIVSSF